MEQITRFNGNGRRYSTDLPKIVWLTKTINDTALNHIAENTNLHFEKRFYGYEAQPMTSNQIVTLFLTYNFKTQYHNNASSKNTLYIKGDHHVGFNVDCICYDCVKKNHIVTNGLNEGDYLAC